MSTTVSTLNIKVGDSVGRQTTMRDPDAPIMWLTVTEVTETSIFCNRWEFDRETGAEVDHEQQWGPEYGKSGGFITRIKQAGVQYA